MRFASLCNAPIAAASMVLAATAACSGPRPEGESAERARADVEGRAFERRHPERNLPGLSKQPLLSDVLHHAFLSNADLERTYFEWRMALERVPQAVALDDPRFSFEHMFSKEEMSRWDRTTLGISQMVPFPGKLELAGRIALEDAIAAGRRFEAAKFALQSSVVSAWNELLRIDRNVAIDESNLRLLRDFAELTRSQIAVGKGAQSDAEKVDLEIAMAENDLATRRAEIAPALAMLNALLSREPLEPLEPRRGGEAEATLPDDASILALAAERNLELQALAAEARGRQDAWELARKAWLPDFDVGAFLTGNLERVLMGAINVPLRVDRIEAGIDEALASTRAAEAAIRARRDDLKAQLVLQIFLARDSGRQVALVRDALLPRASAVVESVRSAYATGSASFLELLDAQRSLLEIERLQAEAEAARATSVAALESLCALDFAAWTGGKAGGS